MMPSSVPQHPIRNIRKTRVNPSFANSQRVLVNKHRHPTPSGLFQSAAQQAAGAFFMAASTLTSVYAQTLPSSFAESSSGTINSSTGTTEGGGSSRDDLDLGFGIALGVIGGAIVVGYFVSSYYHRRFVRCGEYLCNDYYSPSEEAADSRAIMRDFMVDMDNIMRRQGLLPPRTQNRTQESYSSTAQTDQQSTIA